jgi:hypothetical protein
MYALLILASNEWATHEVMTDKGRNYLLSSINIYFHIELLAVLGQG